MCSTATPSLFWWGGLFLTCPPALVSHMFSPPALLVYRVFRNESKRSTKILHGLLHVLALVIALVGESWVPPQQGQAIRKVAWMDSSSCRASLARCPQEQQCAEQGGLEPSIAPFLLQVIDHPREGSIGAREVGGWM